MTTMTTVKYLLLSYMIKNNLNTIFFYSSENGDEFLFETARAAGCNLFLREAMRFLKEKYLKNPRIVLFCPTDASYQAFMAEQQPNKMHLKNVILNHLTKKVGKSEMTYKSTLNGQKITIQSTTINDKVGIDPLYANMLKG